MRIDHRRTQACMTQQYLNCADVASIFKKVGSETVSKSMYRHPFVDIRFSCSSFNVFLEVAWMEMMAPYELPLKNHEKLLNLLYLLRIYDESEEAFESIQKHVISVHGYFAKLDKMK
jgi:hypothetical protein